MNFRSPHLINFVNIDGCDSHLDIGVLNEKEFKQWLKQYSTDLKEHWIKRREEYEKK